MIKRAEAEYTGGNIWLFNGELGDGNFFLTDDYGSTLILNADPALDEDYCYEEWQTAHKVRELEDEELMEFLTELLDHLLIYTDGRNGMDEVEIDAYRNYWKEIYE